MEKSTEKDLAESVVKAIEEDAITESEMETTEGGHNGNCGCKTRVYSCLFKNVFDKYLSD